MINAMASLSLSEVSEVAMSTFHIGISGWRYTPWRGSFYPRGLRQRRELEYASRAVGSIELNGSFYSLQTPERYAVWYAETPDRFLFSVKGPRFITHVKRLREPEQGIANFFASGVLVFRDKLGPLLWQLPPSLKYDPEVIEEFLIQLPKDTDEALAAARHCDEKWRHYPLPQLASERLRHAIEIRHESFLDERFLEQLRRYRIALVMSDSPQRWPYVEDLTSDFVYVRLHGGSELYASGYDDSDLHRWKRRLQYWSQGKQPEDAKLIEYAHHDDHQPREVFCYFDNDVKVRAPFDAYRMMQMLGIDDELEIVPGEPFREAS